MSESSSFADSFLKRNSSKATLSSIGSSFSDSFDDNGLLVPSTYEILPSNNNIISIAVLSSWDNVIGPKALCVWKQNSRANIDNSSADQVDVEEAVKYVVGHTLHGQLANEATQSKNLRTEMFIVPHQNLLVNAIIFGVCRGDDEESIGHSFSIVCNVNSLEYFMKIQYLCDVWQQRMAAIIRVYLSMDNIAGGTEQLSCMLLNLCNMLCSLQLSAFTSCPMVSESYLSMRHVLDRKLLERAIVSHLQTCGCSVVVGNDEKSVNLMINTLAQFVQSKDLATCRPVIREKPWPYYSGLFLQGLLKDQYGEADISSQDVLHSPYPVTIVDVAHGKVRQSSNYHEHSVQRHNALTNELLAVIYTNRQPQTPFGSTFQTVTERGTLIPELLMELSSLPPTESVLQQHIRDFYRKLEYKAISLLKYLECLTDKRETVNPRLIEKFLGLNDQVDFHIILSVAERLRPGTYTYTMTQRFRAN